MTRVAYGVTLPLNFSATEANDIFVLLGHKTVGKKQTNAHR